MAAARARKQEQSRRLLTLNLVLALSVAACVFALGVFVIQRVFFDTERLAVSAEPQATMATRPTAALSELATSPIPTPIVSSPPDEAVLLEAFRQKSKPGEAEPKKEPPASWEAVAEALRSGQRARAEQLLAKLAKSSDPEVRDNALLVQMRSRVSAARAQSRRLDASDRQRLQRLSTQGATSSIRESARKLLSET